MAPSNHPPRTRPRRHEAIKGPEEIASKSKENGPLATRKSSVGLAALDRKSRPWRSDALTAVTAYVPAPRGAEERSPSAREAADTLKPSRPGDRRR